MQVALGIDIGTTSVKTAVIDAAGTCLGFDAREYDLVQPAPGVVEADPREYWERLPEAVASVMRQGNVAPEDVVGVALSSQGQTFLCLDAQGRPMRNAMVWLDSRAAEEARRTEAHFGRDRFYRHTGTPVVAAGFTSSMLLWLREHERETFENAARFALIRDYVALRACGRAAIDETSAVSSGLYDLAARRWWDEMLAFLDLDASRLSEVVRPGEVIGELTGEAAAFLRLRPGTPLVAGAWDQLAATLGAGNLAPGQVTETTGTALSVDATTDVLVFDECARLQTLLHACPGKAVLQAYAPTSGIVLKWFRENFCSPDASYDDLTALARQSPPGARGVTFIPHFEGTGCPSFDPRVTGAMAGLALGHTRGDIVRALVESLAFVLRELVEIVDDLGVAPEEITSLGGGARNALLCQIKADVLGRPVRTLKFGEAALAGDAMLAFVGTGAYRDLDEAAAHMVHPERVYEPDPAGQRAYEDVYARYRDVFAALHPEAAGAD